ncbi:MAG: hypothetical protein F6K35_48390 [Okeania sp. SIO2H7]|nr:hypothetical protein [Okeania sp. SIO2H7]
MNQNHRLSEAEIDNLVEVQARDDSAWEEPIFVEKQPASLSIPAEIAAKAAFVAGLHRETDVETWLLQVIRERLELEEAAYNKGKLS